MSPRTGDALAPGRAGRAASKNASAISVGSSSADANNNGRSSNGGRGSVGRTFEVRERDDKELSEVRV